MVGGGVSLIESTAGGFVSGSFRGLSWQLFPLFLIIGVSFSVACGRIADGLRYCGGEVNQDLSKTRPDFWSCALDAPGRWSGTVRVSPARGWLWRCAAKRRRVEFGVNVPLRQKDKRRDLGKVGGMGVSQREQCQLSSKKLELRKVHWRSCRHRRGPGARQLGGTLRGTGLCA